MPKSNNEMTVFGGKACIAIQYEGPLEHLASTIAKKLNLKEFYIDTDIEPPHQRIAMAESMGWEMWLEENSNVSTYNYRLSMSTENSLKEVGEGKMFDLSPWLARLISSLCDVKTRPVGSS